MLLLGTVNYEWPRSVKPSILRGCRSLLARTTSKIPRVNPPPYHWLSIGIGNKCRAPQFENKIQHKQYSSASQTGMTSPPTQAHSHVLLMGTHTKRGVNMIHYTSCTTRGQSPRRCRHASVRRAITQGNRHSSYHWSYSGCLM